MSKINETELNKQIKSRQFSNIYLIYGTEQLFVQNYTNKLVNAIIGKHPNDFNYHTFTGEINTDDFASALQIVPFMSEYNCVVASDIFFENMDIDTQTLFLDIIKNIGEGTILIVTMPSGICKDTKFLKKITNYIDKNGTIVFFESLNSSVLEKYVSKWAQENGKFISHINAMKIINNCGNDLNLLKNEVTKVAMYAQNDEISAQDIEKLTTISLETKIFDLSDAVINGNGQKAFNILDLLFNNREAPVMMLYVLANSYIDAYRIRVADECGVLQSTVATNFDYKNRAFVLSKSKRATHRVSTQALRKSLDAILQTETNIKSVSHNERIDIEQLIAQLLLIAKEGRI